MGIEYRLTLAGEIPLDRLADAASLDATDLPTNLTDDVLSSSLYEEFGYLVTILSGRNGYYDAEDDGGTLWKWEPSEYVDISFDMDKENPARGVPHMVATVARVLADRDEDAALVLNGNWVLLTRLKGALRKHRPQWWANYGVDHLIP